jgi:hypothetical protein
MSLLAVIAFSYNDFTFRSFTWSAHFRRYWRLHNDYLSYAMLPRALTHYISILTAITLIIIISLGPDYIISDNFAPDARAFYHLLPKIPHTSLKFPISFLAHITLSPLGARQVTYARLPDSYSNSPILPLHIMDWMPYNEIWCFIH